MLFKYKLKNRWYSADIPKEDYDRFLNMTFADKMKYIKNMDTKTEIETSDLGYSVLGTKKEKLKSETFEQLQDKEQKRTLAKNKISELKKLEDKINEVIKDIESKPDDTSDDTKLKELEKLLEQKEILVQQIQTLNVDNVALMDVKHVDTLNIKGINKLVSDLNANNITDTFKQVKDEISQVYNQVFEKNIIQKMFDVVDDTKNSLREVLGYDLNGDEKFLCSILRTISNLKKNYDVVEDTPLTPGDKYVFFKINDKLKVYFGVNTNSLLYYNPKSTNGTSVLDVIKWNETQGNINTDLLSLGFTLPTDKSDSRLEETLENIVNKIAKGEDSKQKLNRLQPIIENVKYILKEDSRLYEILNDVLELIDEKKTQKATGIDCGEGIFSDIKNAPKKIKKLEQKIDALEEMIKGLKVKETPKETPTVPEPETEPVNVFKIPQLRHVEPTKREPVDEFKDLKDILNKRRQDIEYSDDLDDVSEDWEDNYTELTAGSLGDATELIESLRDNYNIVLRMYINKKAKK